MKSEHKKQGKLNKKKKRQQQEAKRKTDYQAKLRHEHEYPKIDIDKTGANPEFMAAVQLAAEQIDFRSKEQFDNQHRRLHSLLASGGKRELKMGLQQATSDQFDAENLFMSVHSHLGEVLYRLIPEKTRKRFLPYNDAAVFISDKRYVIRFTSLQQKKTPNGTLYYSRHQPKIEIAGEELVVAFTGHAIERICERLNTRYLSYSAAGDVHAILSHCNYFEATVLEKNQHAFTFFTSCNGKAFLSYEAYVVGVLGEENLSKEKGSRPYYRLGYAPIAIEDGFAKALTFLYPGYRSTPELQTIKHSKLGHEEKAEMIKRCENLEADAVVLKNDPTIIKWFHENGVPQVIQTTKQIFKYD
ncbi:hypothetical protein N9253_00660 [bacterium]|nr:hypothetical protein [bacterium]